MFTCLPTPHFDTDSHWYIPARKGDSYPTNRVTTLQNHKLVKHSRYPHTRDSRNRREGKDVQRHPERTE